MESIKHLSNLIFATCFAAGFCILTPNLAFAQDENSNEFSADTELEEITVTARKRVENLQEVALSVSAMG